ncbi:hypothetical protein ALP65_04624 [Pseudomonas aeruginosa]|uniref:Uncharacterized protein n=1 Tax=Pseudomonas aeruginosa TaxID=287 RepID=A0A3M5DMW7_PSEAI|nr:hypothetical protein ALP65_04624 [Pseudomonas aeruginosa]
MVHGAAEHAFADREPDPQVVHRQQGFTGRVARRRTAGLGVEQLAGIGVSRGCEEFLAGSLLDDPPLLHDADAVGDAPDQVEVVGDQQQGHAQACLQVLEQIEDLQLDGDVERGGRFVGDQQLRLAGQGHGDHHPLPLAAGEFVWIGFQALGRLGDADQLEQFENSRAGLGATQALVQGEDLGELLLDGMQRIERGHGFLEDHGDAVAADPAQAPFRELEQILALVVDAACWVAGDGVGQQAQDRVGGHRLARAAFADQGQGLALADVEADAFDHPLALLAGEEFDGEVADFQNVLAHLISSGRKRRGRLRR